MKTTTLHRSDLITAFSWLAVLAAAVGPLAPGRVGAQNAPGVITPAGSLVPAQKIIELKQKIEAEGGTLVIGPDGQPTVAPPAAAEAPAPGQPASGKTPEQERLEKFLKLEFDRKPSTILTLWAAPASEGGEAEDGGGEAAAKSNIDAELRAFQRSVTLGEWEAVREALAGYPEPDGIKAYRHLLGKLMAGLQGGRPVPPPNAANLPPGVQPQPQPNQRRMETGVMLPDDLIGLADACPVPIDRDVAAMLGTLVRLALEGDDFIESFVARLAEGTARLGGDDRDRRFAAARVLIAANLAAHCGPFLPDEAAAAAEGNAEALDLMARYFLALPDPVEKKANLEKAWNANLRILASGEKQEPYHTEALTRAVALAPQVRDELGDGWLRESFTAKPEQGMAVLAAIGTAAAQARIQPDPTFRLRQLQLQNTAVEALLTHAPSRADTWIDTLRLLAISWLEEADFSRLYDQTDSMQPQMQFDRFGNMYYADNRYLIQQQQQNRGAQRPIATADLLEIAPGEAWRERLDATTKPRVSRILAQLFLKVNEEEQAFPFIESLAKSHPEETLDLANEFIRVWARNHDPNAQKRMTGRYMYFYGYNQRADAIPLTRSKQVRNLEDLSQWVKRLTALGIGDLDEKALADAFVRTHSQAEVYRLEDIQMVFGEAEGLEPATLAELVQTMRRNLASVWRDPKVQAQSQTKRDDKEISAEVMRGYEVADRILAQGVERHPDSWQLQLVKAAMQFDQLNYRREFEDSPEYAERRREAYGEFARAAELYARALPTLPEEEESSEVFDTWFYASLGASDIGALTHDQVSDARQQELIREAILGLPGDASERHLARFANALSSRISSVKPELKQRFLKAGLTVAGDHEQTAEARKVFEYYDDLVTEIRLETRIDGSDAVGHGRPFGLFVDLRHTATIERESGGFARYLQNQNNSPYAYNYGRPTENYRDKFEEAAREALSEDFDVLSVTFRDAKGSSIEDPEPDWRITPYAYLLLKARGPEVDAVPPLRMDLDFLDTTGFVVLPIESGKLPVDARAEDGDVRPFADLAVTQTLDERRAGEGRLAVEIKATARGLVPKLDEILDLKPADFEVAEIEDQGVAVMQLDVEGEVPTAVTERNWVVEFAARDELAEVPRTFRFAAPIVDVKESVFQRYEDADLATAEAEVVLEEQYGSAAGSRVAWWAGLGLLVLVVLGIAWSRRRTTPPPAAPVAFRMPEEVTPFTVITLLRRIREAVDTPLTEADRAELDASIQGLEQRFFREQAAAAEDPGDLRGLAESWVRKAA